MKEKDRVIFHHSSKWHCEYLEKIISSYMAPHESKKILKKLLQCCLLMRPQIQGQPLWKTQQWPQEWKRSVFIPIPKKGNAKECSDYCPIALVSHASMVILKILQDRL